MMPGDVIIKPKTPKGGFWQFDQPWQVLGYPGERWFSVRGHIVITAVEVAATEEIELGPEYHVSVSFRGGRMPAASIPWFLKEWDMEGADEDNHVPNAIARHFWKPVAEKYHGYVCPCKENEHAIVEGDYIWRPLPA